LHNSLISCLEHEFFFAFKTIIITFLFIFVRANLPRFRFDQLMFIGWKIFLPITLSFLLFFSGLLFSCNSLNVSQLPRINNSYNFIQIFSIRF
jgi:NADH-quinone oxidoreductase subunit H